MEKQIKSRNYIENIIVITSKIIVNEKIGFTYSKKRSLFTSDERLNQTINTIHSIKEKFKNKNYKIILIDNSKFSNNIIELLQKKVDIFLHRNIIDNIDYYTDISIVKGFGEAKQQDIVNKWIYNNNITFKHLFKITGRYLLNDNFNYTNYNNNKCNFKLAVEVIKKHPNIKDYYYTSLYKIHYNYFEIFNLAINTIINNEQLILKKYVYEMVLAVQLLNYDIDCILNTKTLGVTQNLSCRNMENYKEELYI